MTSWEDYRIEPLSAGHDRASFDCGEAPLNDFLQRFARQNEKKDLTRTYVLTRKDAAAVCGYSSVRFGHVAFDVLPETDRKKLARYPVPTFLIARFAVDKRHQGRRLGELLLMHALRLANDCADRAGLFAVEVDAKTAAAAAFYGKYGFQRLLDDELHMYLALKTVRAMLGTPTR